MSDETASIVIPVHGRSDLLASLIKSMIPQHQHIRDVVIVDDGSPLEESFRIADIVVGCGATYYVLPENHGFSYACNMGMGLTSGDRVLFVNSDIELLPGCISEMLSVDADIVGARLLYPDDRIQHGGAVYSPATGFFDHRFRFCSRNYPPAMRTEPHLVTGALLLARKSVIHELGGFDEQLRMAFEDIDLELRAITDGYSVVYHGKAEAYHLEGATRGNTESAKAAANPEWLQWENESQERFHERWPRDFLLQFTGG